MRYYSYKLAGYAIIYEFVTSMTFLTFGFTGYMGKTTWQIHTLVQYIQKDKVLVVFSINEVVRSNVGITNITFSFFIEQRLAAAIVSNANLLNQIAEIKIPSGELRLRTPLGAACQGGKVDAAREILKMKADLGILWLVAVAVFALLPRAEVFVHGIQTALAIEDTQVALELKLGLFDGDTAAVVADAPERLEDDRNEALVVHRAGQIDVAEVAGVGLVVQVPHTRVVGPAIDRLAIDLRLVPRDTGGDLAAVNGEGLRHRVLALLFCSQGLVPPRV